MNMFVLHVKLILLIVRSAMVKVITRQVGEAKLKLILKTVSTVKVLDIF